MNINKFNQTNMEFNWFGFTKFNNNLNSKIGKIGKLIPNIIMQYNGVC